MSTTAIIGATKTKSLCTQTRFPSEKWQHFKFTVDSNTKRIKYQIFDMDGRLITSAESGYFKNADADYIMPSIDIKPNTYFNVQLTTLRLQRKHFQPVNRILLWQTENNCVIKYCK